MSWSTVYDWHRPTTPICLSVNPSHQAVTPQTLNVATRVVTADNLLLSAMVNIGY